MHIVWPKLQCLHYLLTSNSLLPSYCVVFGWCSFGFQFHHLNHVLRFLIILNPLSSLDVCLKDLHHLASKAWLLKIGYLSSYINFWIFHLKKFAHWVFFALQVTNPKKRRKFCPSSLVFSFNFFVNVFFFAFHFFLFVKFAILFLVICYVCSTYLCRNNKATTVRSFKKI